jgi:hypothetical protein
MLAARIDDGRTGLIQFQKFHFRQFFAADEATLAHEKGAFCGFLGGAVRISSKLAWF